MLKNRYQGALLVAIGLSVSTLTSGQAQTIIGMGTDHPNPNAVLELVPENGNQGFLAPRLNSAQRTASSFTTKLTDADNGLLVFDTETGQFFYWYQGEWHTGVSTGEGGAGPINHGTTWYTGATEPRGIQARQGDFYINESTGDVYKFSNLSFAIIGSLGESAAPGQTPNLSSVLQQDNSAAQQKITDLGEPTEANDAVTKEYVDQLIGRTPPIIDLDNQNLSDVLTEGTGGNDAGRNKIVNLEHPDDPRDAATKNYVDDEIDNLVPLFGTDNQQITFNTTTNSLSIENGNSVDLSSLAGGIAALPENQIFMGNTSGQATPVTVFGDIEVAAGAAKITDDAVTKAKINPDVAGAGLSQAGNGSLQVNVGGDVATSGSNLKVIKLQGNNVATTTPSLKQVLMWDGSQWIPTTLSNAGTWFTGTGHPDVTPTPDVTDGDYYFQTGTQTVYLRSTGSWNPVGSLAGPTITTPETLSGGPVPSGNDGKKGDFYIKNSGEIYIKVKDNGNPGDRWVELNKD